MKLFAVKSIPIVSWSSDKALNFRPRLSTLCVLCAGLTVFGLGEALLIASAAGNSPWTVLSQGVSQISGWSIGVTTFLTSLAVLLLWIPLKQAPGIGTILNAVIIAIAIDLSLAVSAADRRLSIESRRGQFSVYCWSVLVVAYI